MAAAKKQQSGSAGAAWVRRLFSWVFGSGLNIVVLVLLVGGFVGGTWWAWAILQGRVLSGPEYRIGSERVEITPQPSWISQSNVGAEVLRSPALDGQLSLTDDDLTKRVYDAFTRHPWVAKVERVKKEYGCVKVALVYRKPACMVQLPGGGLVGVDAEAVLLPGNETGDITPTEAARYPRLVGMDRDPTGPAGTRWGDARVIGAAEIAAALADRWEPMRLDHIELSAADTVAARLADSNGQMPANNIAGPAAEPIFTLVTRRGTRIAWGYAPGANAVGELSATEKVARLQRYFEQYDGLDGPEGKAQTLDVRTLPTVRP